MGKKYRVSNEYFYRRQERLLRHRLRRKNKKYNPNHIPLTQNNKRVIPPTELILFKNKEIKDVSSTIQLPEIFSITQNSKETLNKLYEIASLFFKESSLTISILCDHTKSMDLSALIILDIIIVKGRKYLNNLGFKCVVNGNLPPNKEEQELFIFSGLPKHLNLLKGISPQVEILDPFCTINDTNLETHRIIEYYDKCLRRNGYKLNNKGIAYFNKLINEIVDNARIHNGYREKFYCGGFYSHNIKKGQLSIISFGKTIYESLNSESTSENIKTKIQEYIKDQKRFFDVNYNKEMSWTVFALQYKISRLNSIDTPDRGTGTIQFIEAFMDMGQTINNDKPLMSLVSGNTHILFDGTYTLKEEKIENEMVKVIAFNKNNNLKEKPDKNYVKDLDIKFPGVIINVEFFMDPVYLEKFKENDINER
ncbi:MAG: hypothetical protein HFG33_06045 [Bacilli bacterium]|nr:hypothetical protein [Bacilli bacterium]